MLCIHACMHTTTQQHQNQEITACETYVYVLRHDRTGVVVLVLDCMQFMCVLLLFRTYHIICTTSCVRRCFVFALFCAFESGKLPAQSYPFKEAKTSKYKNTPLFSSASQLPAPSPQRLSFRLPMLPAPSKRSPCAVA